MTETLPTDPGFYFDKDGDIWLLTIKHTWYYLDIEGIHSASPTPKFGPYRPVKDAAA